MTLFKTQRFSPMARSSVTRSHVSISALIGQNTGILGSGWSVQSHTALWFVEAGCHRTWDCAALSFTSPPQAQVTNIGHLNWIMEWKGFENRRSVHRDKPSYNRIRIRNWDTSLTLRDVMIYDAIFDWKGSMSEITTPNLSEESLTLVDSKLWLQQSPCKVQGDSFHWESGTGVLQSLIWD